MAREQRFDAVFAFLDWLDERRRLYTDSADFLRDCIAVFSIGMVSADGIAQRGVHPHHSSGESESVYGSSRRLSFGSQFCVEVSSQRSMASWELRMTGCRSCSHALSLLAAVVTIVNVQRGSDWPRTSIPSHQSLSLGKCNTNATHHQGSPSHISRQIT